MSPSSPTCYLTQRHSGKFVKSLFGGAKDAEAVLQRLDRLTQEEARTTAAEILNIVHGLVQDMSEQMRSTCPPQIVDYSTF